MERLTHERRNGIKSGYWSPERKEELVQRLAAYEDTGLTPEEVMEWLEWRWCRLELPVDDGNYLVTMEEPGYNGGRPYTNWLCWDCAGQEWTDTDGDTLPGQETVVAWMHVPRPAGPSLDEVLAHTD